MKKISLLILLVILAWSCEDRSVSEPTSFQRNATDVSLPEALKGNKNFNGGRVEIQLAALLNKTMFAHSRFKVSEIHTLTMANASTNVQTLDQQFESTLTSRWVTNDARRNWNGDNDLNDIDWMPYPPLSTANGTIDVNSIYNAMYAKWQTGGSCKTVKIDRNPFTSSVGNPSAILSIGGLPPAEVPSADISVVGFIPGSIFESVFGSPDVLGVTFSFVFIDPVTGNPTVTTRGKQDKAYAEVWFNDSFRWSKGATPNSVDLESVILHEFGHSLNLGHFGILQQFTQSDGSSKLVYQPVNTMNAFYIGELRNFLGENDKGNYCEAWGSWPWN